MYMFVRDKVEPIICLFCTFSRRKQRGEFAVSQQNGGGDLPQGKYNREKLPYFTVTVLSGGCLTYSADG